MVLKCCVCKIQTDDPNGSKVSFHKLPAREGLREEWMEILRKHCPSVNQKYIYVCSQHFEKHCFQYTGLCQRRMLKSGSTPTIFSCFQEVKCEKNVSSESPGPVTQLENIDEESTQVENDLQLTVKTEPDSTFYGNNMINYGFSSPRSDDILNQVASDKIVSDNRLTQSIQRQNAKIQRLRRENRNLKVRLGRCRKKLNCYKHLFEPLRRTKYISEGDNAARSSRSSSFRRATGF